MPYTSGQEIGGSSEYALLTTVRQYVVSGTVQINAGQMKYLDGSFLSKPQSSRQSWSMLIEVGWDRLAITDVLSLLFFRACLRDSAAIHGDASSGSSSAHEISLSTAVLGAECTPSNVLTLRSLFVVATAATGEEGEDGEGEREEDTPGGFSGDCLTSMLSSPDWICMCLSKAGVSLSTLSWLRVGALESSAFVLGEGEDSTSHELVVAFPDKRERKSSTSSCNAAITSNKLSWRLLLSLTSSSYCSFEVAASFSNSSTLDEHLFSKPTIHFAGPQGPKWPFTGASQEVQLARVVILGGHRAPFFRKWVWTLLFLTFLSIEWMGKRWLACL